MSFADRLRELRLKQGLTQEELAKKAGISARMIQKYEAGVCRPRMTAAVQISEAFNVTVDSLLNEQDIAVAEFGEANGRRAERDFMARARDFSAMMAGGDIPEEDKDAAFKMIMAAYTHSTGIDRELYTPKKYKKSSKK